MNKVIDFLGIKVNALTRDEMIKTILEFALKGKQKMVTYLNTHCVNIAFTDTEYRKILNLANIVYADGISIVWASRFLGNSLLERVNILDFFDILVRELRDKRITIYLLGGKSHIVKKTEEALKGEGLKIIGSKNGFFDKTEEKEIIREINILKPDILMVGMGVPKQEKWIDRHLQELDVNLCWALGAAFDWLSGQRKRAPRWMIKCGFEWIHRLYQQPKRLWKRYLIGNLVFIYYVLSWKIREISPFAKA